MSSTKKDTTANDDDDDDDVEKVYEPQQGDERPAATSSFMDKVKHAGDAVVGGIKDITTNKIATPIKSVAQQVADTTKTAVVGSSSSSSNKNKAVVVVVSPVVVAKSITPDTNNDEPTTTTTTTTAHNTNDDLLLPADTKTVAATGETTKETNDPEDNIESSTHSFLETVKQGGETFVGGIKQGGETFVSGIKQGGETVAGGVKSVGRSIASPIERATGIHLDTKSKGVVVEEEPEEVMAEGELPPIPPDETLKKMDIIISKRLKGLTVQQFHDTVWKEDPDKPLYRKWLDASGKNDIEIQDWQIMDDDVKGLWDGESYQKERTVNFQFTRTTHLYTGPPIASVKHTQWCRVDDDECVLAMQIEMQGIPFADCFNVQIRWVVTRMGTDTDLKIQVGLFVNFVQQTILAGKIRSGTGEETTKTQMSLFHTIKKACAEVAGDASLLEEDEDDLEIEPKVDWLQAIQQAFTHFLSELFGKHRNDGVSKKARSATEKLQKITELWDASLDPEDDDTITVIDSELTDVHASLDKIMKQLENHGL